MKSSNPGDVTAKLRSWNVEPPVPASFQREVWRRIACRQAVREEPFRVDLFQWFSSQLSNPQFVIAVVLLCLSASVGAARFEAQEANARFGKALEMRYAASVDPLAMTAR